VRKIIILVLAFVLTGCGAVAPADTPTAAPTSTPVILVQTVVVTVIPTQVPTEVPTSTPVPTLAPQIIVVTATGAAPAAAAPAAGPTNTAEASVPNTGAATATLPADAGGAIFTNLTRSSDHFALRCQPDTITFGISTSNPYVTEVDFFYRIEDRLSVSISGWVNAGKMQTDKNGNFTLDFNSASVDPDLRSHKAWLDYEFVGINKLGDAVGRTSKIVKQITYTIDCSD
jgi:hypothetical protein